MEYTDEKIKRQLDYWAGTCTVGLFNGKSGAALAGFLLAEQTGSSIYHAYAEKMLAEVFQLLEEVDSLDFRSGLAGIGWMMEWVEQEGFFFSHSLDMLYNVDDFMYQVVTMCPVTMTLDGSIGYLLYMCKRLLNRRPLLYPYRRLALQECALYLVRKMEEKLHTLQDRKDGIRFYRAVKDFYRTSIQDTIALSMLQQIEECCPRWKDASVVNETSESEYLLRFLFNHRPKGDDYGCLFDSSGQLKE